MLIDISNCKEPVIIDDAHVLEFAAYDVTDRIFLENGKYVTVGVAREIRITLDADAVDAAHHGLDLRGRLVYGVTVDGRQLITLNDREEIFEISDRGQRQYVALV